MRTEPDNVVPRFVVELSDPARRDLRSHRAWYRARDRCLVRRLNEELLSALEVLRDSPTRWATWLREPYRRTLLDRFPYSVIYRIDDRVVTVVAILPTSRDPSARFPEDDP